jgi:hypothetical protein
MDDNARTPRRRGGYTRRDSVNYVKAPRPDTTSNTVLECGCTRNLIGNFNVGQEMYCVVHKKLSHIKSTGVEFVVDCIDCHYRKRRGQEKLTAHTVASKHALTRRHRVHIYYGAKVIHTVGNQTGQLTIESLEPPPF